MAGGTGEVTVDFGTGVDQVTITVARASVTGTAHVEAYVFPKDTSNHTVDEHIIDPPNVFAHSVNPGIGFSITAVSPSGRSLLKGALEYLIGVFNIRWVSTE